MGGGGACTGRHEVAQSQLRDKSTENDKFQYRTTSATTSTTLSVTLSPFIFRERRISGVNGEFLLLIEKENR